MGAAASLLGVPDPAVPSAGLLVVQPLFLAPWFPKGPEQAGWAGEWGRHPAFDLFLL